MVDSGFLKTNLPYFAQQLIEVQTRLNDELAARLFFSISPTNPNTWMPFAPKSTSKPPTNIEEAWTPVFGSFPSTKYDVLEALKSYALGRNTACVFHLMRVLELGLGALGTVFNVSLAHTNWAPAIDAIESHIRNMHRTRHGKRCRTVKSSRNLCASRDPLWRVQGRLAELHGARARQIRRAGSGRYHDRRPRPYAKALGAAARIVASWN